MPLRNAVLSAFLVAAICGCGSDDTEADAAGDVGDTAPTQTGDGYVVPDRWQFPDSFMFGTAVAGLQVDMGCPSDPPSQCEPRNSDWYRFLTSSRTIGSDRAHLSGDPVDRQAGFWELYERDLRRADERLQNDAFRFSIEWSRIFPKPTDDLETLEELRAAANDRAVRHYHRLLRELQSRGMEPVVTLNHYSLPTWIHDPVECHVDFGSCEKRGWVDRERIVEEIRKYARFAAREFGAQVDWWATLNEPMAVIVPGYIQPSEERTNPPAAFLRVDAAKTVLQAMIEAHARMYDAIHAADVGDTDGDGTAAKVGLVTNVSPVKPADPDSQIDREAADNVDYLYNRIFLNALVDGEYDGDLDGEPTDRSDLEGRMDYVGINYYATIRVEGREDSLLPGLSPLLTFNPSNFQTVWRRPEGLYEAVTTIHEEYGRPVVVTENGTPIDESRDRPGTDVRRYLVRHLAGLNRAMADGADVRGYFYWSLLDTYEWNKGMGPKMGLFGFDPDDPRKRRVERPAVRTYRRIASEGRIPPEMREAYLSD